MHDAVVSVSKVVVARCALDVPLAALMWLGIDCVFGLSPSVEIVESGKSSRHGFARLRMRKGGSPFSVSIPKFPDSSAFLGVFYL